MRSVAIASRRTSLRRCMGDRETKHVRQESARCPREKSSDGLYE